MLVTTAYDSAWTNKGAEYLLNVLDMDAGAFRFEKPLKVRGRILEAEMIPAGILFVTTSEAGILDSKTGQPTSKEAVESDDSVIAAEKDGKMYIFSTGQQALYLLDKAAGTIRKISDRPVEFEDDEIPFSLEIADGQITVVSNQNIAAFTPDGHVLYHEYHPAPRRSAFVRAMLIANSIRAGMASAASGMVGGAFAAASAEQEPGSAGNTLAAGMAQGYGEMAVGLGSLSKRYMDAARERFNASTNTSEYVFMMVQTEDSFGLAKVAKETGKIVAIMDMNKDKSPSYQVDTIANRMYYRSKPNEILGFQL